MIELFVVLQIVSGAVVGDAADHIRTRYEVVATLLPRLLVVRLAVDDLAALQGLAGIAAIAADTGELDVTPPLSEAERLFVAGWAARGIKTGPRAGDGQTWDAPGFEPPGAPRR